IVMKRLEANNFAKRFIGEITMVNGDSGLTELFSRNTVTDELCCRLGLEVSGFFGKLACLSCIDEKSLYSEYEAILKAVGENRFSDNLTVKRLVEKIHAEMLGKTEGGFQK
ncbi:MAG: hypothetical protein QXS04_04610, partial [Thermoproteota archaeon]